MTPLRWPCADGSLCTLDTPLTKQGTTYRCPFCSHTVPLCQPGQPCYACLTLRQEFMLGGLSSG